MDRQTSGSMSQLDPAHVGKPKHVEGGTHPAFPQRAQAPHHPAALARGYAAVSCVSPGSVRSRRSKLPNVIEP
jgi:hypothetical protein